MKPANKFMGLVNHLYPHLHGQVSTDPALVSIQSCSSLPRIITVYHRIQIYLLQESISFMAMILDRNFQLHLYKKAITQCLCVIMDDSLSTTHLLFAPNKCQPHYFRCFCQCIFFVLWFSVSGFLKLVLIGLGLNISGFYNSFDSISNRENIQNERQYDKMK